ncbi:MAG: GNAT family N-acetyltransferase [Bacilli bacterium]|nr:GNAT family N-acetyltransferase [Bacilli bacterium]
MEIRNIKIGTDEFLNICDYVEKNINRENLSANGGTLNYSNLTYSSDILFIAFDNNTPVGYNSVVKCDGGYYIYQIAVKKEYQGQGIGTDMLKEIVKIADEEGVFITAHVMNYNTASQKMFKSLGFIKLSEKKGNGFYARVQKVNDIKYGK